MAAQQPIKMLAGDTVTLLLTFRDEEGDLMNLDTDVSEIELEVKASDNGADPALIAISLTGGEITRLTQSGDTLGQAHALIASDETAPPFTPGRLRYDVVAIKAPGGERVHSVPPSDFEVGAVVNQAAVVP